MEHQEMMERLADTRQKPDWSFYIAWVSLTTLCIPIAYLLDLIILWSLTAIIGDYIYVDGVRHITEDYLATYFLFPSMGILTGLAQHGLLRQHLSNVRGWVLATAAGWIGGTIPLLLPGWVTWAQAPINVSLLFTSMGFIIGLLQWIVLRKRLPRSGWWIVANVIGWGILSLFMQGNALDQFTLLMLGFFPAAMTAIALAYLLNRQRDTVNSTM